MTEEINIQIRKPSEFADYLGEIYTSQVSKDHKKGKGQFFTPTEIADFMANLVTKPQSRDITILDPGCGTGVLSCSLIEKLTEFEIDTIEHVAFETDYKLFPFIEKSFQNLKSWLKNKEIGFSYTLLTSDFIEDMVSALEIHRNRFDYIISNPPYFKLSKDDKRVSLLKHLVKGQPNIYSFFMAVSVNLLKETGDLIYIIPRSFASGQYFNSFRNYFFKHINLSFIHLFKSRKKTFDRDKVLLETLILKGSKSEVESIVLSTSEGINDLGKSAKKKFQLSELIDLKSEAKILHLPITVFEEEVINLFKSWSNTLKSFEIQISTGPVVSFRSRQFLYDEYTNSTFFLAPLYWLHNVNKMGINYPHILPNKSQYIRITDESKKILIPNKNYVLLRRFSSKDDKSRLIASPYFSKYSKSEFIGVENKVNYIYKLNGELTQVEAIGISALLNSVFFDTYFRTFNGNVNVSATEIRLMPFPDISVIREIGNLLKNKKNLSEEVVNTVVKNCLYANTEIEHD